MAEKKKYRFIRFGALSAATVMAGAGGGCGGEDVGQSSAAYTTNLVLQEMTNECNANQVQDIFRITNFNTTPVKLSDLSIQLWVNEATANAIQTSVFDYGCVLDPGTPDPGSPGASCDHWVTGLKMSVAATPSTCAGQEANYVVTITTKDTSLLAPGQSWSHIATGLSLPRQRAFTPGPAQWYSGCVGPSYASTRNVALYYQGSLAHSSTGIPPACVTPMGTQPVGGATSPGIASGQIPLVGPLAPTTPMFLGISLEIPPANVAALQAQYEAIYNPNSAQYGQYLTPAQFGAATGIKPSDYASVVTYLQNQGLTVVQQYASLAHISVSGTAAAVESALNVTLNVYSRPDGSTYYAPANDPSINLSVPIAFVAGLDSYATPRGNSAGFSNCPQTGDSGSAYLGDDFKNIYFGPTVSQTGAGTRAAIVAFDGLAFTGTSPNYAYPDLLNYQTATGRANAAKINVKPPLPLGTPPLTPGNTEGEVALAAEMLYALAPSANIDIWEFPSQLSGPPSPTNFNGSASAFITLMNRIVDDGSANVIVNPWTWQSGTGVTDSGVAQVLLQAAVQGMGFFQAAGDSGGFIQGTCQTTGVACSNDFMCTGGNHCVFTGGFCNNSPNGACTLNSQCTNGGTDYCNPFGAMEPIINSPLETVVGGTVMPQQGTCFEGLRHTCSSNTDCCSGLCNPGGMCATGEAAWYDDVASPHLASGGGYAIGYSVPSGLTYPSLALPSYQTAASLDYAAKANASCPGGNPTCNVGVGNTVRMLPDVAMMATQIQYYTQGSSSPLTCPGGTSAATALWAGVALLVDDKAINDPTNPRPPIGFVNPTLYSKAYTSASTYAGDFNDVTVSLTGSGHAANPNVTGVGQAVQTKYDLATGLGSPSAGLLGATGLLPAQSCSPGGNLTVLINGSTVTAYAPNGSWSESGSGVQVITIENGTASLPNPVPVTGSVGVGIVNTCSADSSATGNGNVVCTGNDNTVYLIRGTSLLGTVASAANTTEGEFSGGQCENCNVAVDPFTHMAYLSIGFGSYPTPAAIQALNLTTAFNSPTAAGPAFSAPIPINAYYTSEAIQVDDVRGVVLSPNEQNNYQLIKPGLGKAYDFPMNGLPGIQGSMDSAAEDCSTGIAVASMEFATGLVLVDLNMAQYKAGSPNGTWAPGQCTAPNPLTGQAVGCVDNSDCTVGTCNQFYGAGISLMPEIATDIGVIGGATIASDGSHLGIVATEFGGSRFSVIKLPAVSGVQNPQLADYVAVSLPNTPDGNPFVMGHDPHTIGIYTSPTDHKTYGIFQDDFCPAAMGGTPYGCGSRSYLAIVDLAALLAMKDAGTHTISAPIMQCQGAPVVGSGCVVRYIAN